MGARLAFRGDAERTCILTSIFQLLVAGNFLMLAWGRIPFLLVLPIACVLFLSARNLCSIAHAKHEQQAFPAKRLARSYWLIAALAAGEAVSMVAYWSGGPYLVLELCVVYGLPPALQAVHLLLHDSCDQIT